MIAKKIVCRLDELMRARGLNQEDLYKLCRVDRERISKLRDGTWSKVSKDVLGRLCAALRIELHELLQAYPGDIWYPIRRHGSVTVHLGSTSLEPAGEVRHPGPALDRQGIGTWDVRALFKVSDHLNSTTPGGVVFKFTEHVETLHDPARVAAVFDDGCHLILGSPIVNPIAEDAVCRGFGVPARSPAAHDTMPFRFLWERHHPSAIGGEASTPGEFGIARRGSTALVARRTVVGPGERQGEDCGLLYTYRFNPRDAASEDDDRIIIAIMGHSGCGTLAGTMLACEDETASALYPPSRARGVLRAFSATYARPAIESQGEASGFDNRTPMSWMLVDRGA